MITADRKLPLILGIVVLGMACGGKLTTSSKSDNNLITYPPNSVVFQIQENGRVHFIGAFPFDAEANEYTDLTTSIPDLVSIRRLHKGAYFMYYTKVGPRATWKLYRSRTLTASEDGVLLSGTGQPPSFGVLGDESTLMYSLITQNKPGQVTSTIRTIDLHTLEHKTLIESVRGVGLPVGSIQRGLFCIKVTEENQADISIYLFDGVRLIDLHANAFDPRHPRFSQDGRYLYTAEGISPRREIRRYDTILHRWETMTSRQERIMAVIPSPDGKRLAFYVQANVHSPWTLYVMPAIPYAQAQPVMTRPGTGYVGLAAWTSHDPANDIGIDFILNAG